MLRLWRHNPGSTEMNFLIPPMALEKTPQVNVIKKLQRGVDLDQIKRRDVLIIKEYLIGQ